MRDVARLFPLLHWSGMDDGYVLSLAHPNAVVAMVTGKSEITGHFTIPPLYELELKNKDVHQIISSDDVLGGKHTTACCSLRSAIGEGECRARAVDTTQTLSQPLSKILKAGPRDGLDRCMLERRSQGVCSVVGKDLVLTARRPLSVAYAVILWCAGCPVAKAEDVAQPIHIGIDIPLTGAFADSIKPVMMSDQLWVKQVNARGGLLGRKVEITFIDNKSSPEVGVAVYQRLVQGGYDFIFEDGGSAMVQRESTLAEQYKKLMLAPAGFARALYERGYKYTFFTGNCLSDDVATGYAKMLEALPDAARPKSIAYTTLQNIAFTAATRGAQQSTKPLDMKVLLDLTYPPSINDATPLISDLKQAGPDLVFQTGMSGDTVMFVRAAKAQGLTYKLLSVGYTAASLPNFLSIVGDAAEGAVYATGWEPEAKLGHNAEFVAAYQHEYGVIPTYNSANGYARWEILEQLVNATKSLDQAVLREKLVGGTFDTVNGTIRIGEKGYSVPDSTLVVQFQQGKRVIVWPKEQSNGILVYPATH